MIRILSASQWYRSHAKGSNLILDIKDLSPIISATNLIISDSKACANAPVSADKMENTCKVEM